MSRHTGPAAGGTHAAGSTLTDTATADANNKVAESNQNTTATANVVVQ